jgi:hypothetical protein
LYRLEENVLSLGNWHSIDELEEHLTLEELHRLFLAQQREKYNDKMFNAALQGIKLDPYDDPDYEDVTTFEELKQRVAEKQREANHGATSSYPEFESMGFTVEEY